MTADNDPKAQDASKHTASPPVPELPELAERFVALWGDQLAALASDPEFAETLGTLMNPWVRVLRMAAAGVPRPTDFPAADQNQQARSADERSPAPPAGTPAGDGFVSPAGTPAGAEAPAPASDAGNPYLAELAARLGAIEQRLAALEAASRGTGGRDRSSPRRRRQR